MWQYNLDGLFDDVIIEFIGSTAILTIVDKHDINLDASVPESVYQSRIQENINATQAEITIFALQRSESAKYEITVINNKRQRARNGVTVQVQCKLTTSGCEYWISIDLYLVKHSEARYKSELAHLSFFYFVLFCTGFLTALET